ncbi:MAG TPA: SRPBCC family protein [Pseudonocardia sp.]|jgi:hypothetical protein
MTQAATHEDYDDEPDDGSDGTAGPGEALRDAGQQLLGLLVSRAAEMAMQRVDGLTGKLTDVAEGGGIGAAFGGGKGRDDGDDDGDDDGEESGGKSPAGVVKSGLSGLKDKVKGMFGGGSGGGGSGGGGKGKKPKVTNIVEETDIGLPLRVTYNLWTQFEDFPGFMKKVKSVEQAAEEKVNWKATIFWSNRTWEATIVEQVPDSHIVWRSKGAKGHVNGAITFTELGRNLTRVLLVLEYYPQGLFERTGNIWRAQGRRARLEFKHFRRNAMSDAILRQDEIEGWRGEIRDSEVVRTHEEALEEEQQAEESSAGSAEDEYTDEPEAADEEYEGDAYDDYGDTEDGADDELDADEELAADDELDDDAAADEDTDADTDADAETDDEDAEDGYDDRDADSDYDDEVDDEYEDEDETDDDEYLPDDDHSGNGADPDSRADDEEEVPRQRSRRPAATARRGR